LCKSNVRYSSQIPPGKSSQNSKKFQALIAALPGTPSARRLAALSDRKSSIPTKGAQFTPTAFTEVLKSNQVQISMDGRGRVQDNIFIERL